MSLLFDDGVGMRNSTVTKSILSLPSHVYLFPTVSIAIVPSSVL